MTSPLTSRTALFSLVATLCLSGISVGQAAKRTAPRTPGGAPNGTEIRLRVMPRKAAAGAFLNAVGVPFPRGARIGRLSLTTAAGAPVPCQSQVNVRHPDGSARWVHLAFVTRPGVDEYILRCGARPDSDRGVAAPRLSVTAKGRQIVVNTGATTFELDTQAFLPFRRILYKGKTVLEAPARGGLSLQGRYFSSRASATIEERGPVRAQIAYTGKLISESGAPCCSFSARLHFAAGRPWVQMDVTLYQDTEQVFLDLEEFALDLKMPAIDSAVFYANPKAAPIVAGKPPAVYRQEGKKLVDQRWSYPWSVRTGAAAAVRGQRGRGAGAVRLADGPALEFAVQDFWQNGPKSVEVSTNGIRFGLYPRTGERLPLHVGMAKTHRIFLQILPRAGNSLSATAEAYLAKARAFPESRWYCACGEPVRMTPRQAGRFQGYERFMDQALERRFVFQREAYGEYGWLNFGDFRQGMFAGYWNNNETMLDHGLFVQFARTGDKRCFDWGEETLRHYQDIDLRHHRPERAFDYGILMGPGVDRETARQWGEKSRQERKKRFVYFSSSLTQYAPYVHGFYHFGQKGHGLAKGTYYCGGSLNQGHCFMLGHLTYYYMTGDKHSLEMARRVGGVLLKKFRSRTVNRATAMPALFLLELYAATGDNRYLDRVREAIGFWLAHKDRHPYYMYIVSRTLARFHELTGDASVRKFFLERLDAYINKYYTAKDGLRDGVLAPVQQHRDCRFYTQLADLADAFALTGKRGYVSRGVATLETLVENHGFDAVALSSTPRFLAACARVGKTGIAKHLPDDFKLRFPDKKVFHFLKEAGKPLEIRLYSDTGFRSPKGIPVDGRIVVIAPDKTAVMERAVHQSGFYTHVFLLDAARPAGIYRAEATAACVRKGRKRKGQLLWNAWSSNGKVMAELIRGFLSVDQSSIYFQVPKGCAGFGIELRPMLTCEFLTLAYSLYDPAGRLRRQGVYPRNSNTPRTIRVLPVPPGTHGLWRLRLPFGKNYLKFNGIPPLYATRHEACFPVAAE